jgi:hypothetical protein
VVTWSLHDFPHYFTVEVAVSTNASGIACHVNIMVGIKVWKKIKFVDINESKQAEEWQNCGRKHIEKADMSVWTTAEDKQIKRGKLKEMY